MLIYTKEIIEHTTLWMEDDPASKRWLQANKLEELVQLKDAVSRHAKAFEYLLRNKHLILATFVNAIWDDKKAFAILMTQKEFNWAAMANFINGDEKAAGFLQNNNLRHFVNLAAAIQTKIRRDGDAGTSMFSGPYKKQD